MSSLKLYRTTTYPIMPEALMRWWMAANNSYITGVIYTLTQITDTSTVESRACTGTFHMALCNCITFTFNFLNLWHLLLNMNITDRRTDTAWQHVQHYAYIFVFKVFKFVTFVTQYEHYHRVEDHPTIYSSVMAYFEPQLFRFGELDCWHGLQTALLI